ncbi:hypothetical protein MLD38_008592 [Melastoma candidum]|uniref:Uncharacterized protein n=2 Tax=Melastoma candidum TaxID=119954 RepID=A0ACB9RXX1_9MYRT|nr:hypothetical protein MLD38_008592 [Melastoma candidum]
MQVPHKASATRGGASRSSPLTSPDAVDPKCQKSSITCGLPRISKSSLQILAEHSSPRARAAQPSVSHTPAVAKKRTRRSDDSSTKLDKDCESVNPKKPYRNGISLHERSDLLMVDNQNCSKDLTVGSEVRVNNTNPNKQSCSSLAKPQGDSLPVQALEAGKCQDKMKDSEYSGINDDKSKRLPSETKRSKKQIPRKRNSRTIHSVASGMNREIESVVPENIDSEPVKESNNAQASSENITNDAPKTSCSSVSKMSRLGDVQRRAGMIARPAERFFQVPTSSGSEEQHILHEKSHVAGVTNNREPSTASFMPTRQWVGVGRRQLRSRDGRMSIAFPVSASSNMQQEGCGPSRHERIVSAKANRLESAKDGASCIPHLKVKLNGRALPAGLSEYGARPHDRIISTEMTADGAESSQRSLKKVQLSNSILVAQKNTMFQHEAIFDGKKRGERNIKISRFAKSGDSSPRERSDARDLKPVGAVDKNGSKTGFGSPPVGKLSDQMNSTLQENSLLYGGTCDDWNELFDAPNLAFKSSCLTSFEDLWKEMESVQVTHKNRSSPKEQGELIDGHIPELQTKVNEGTKQILISQSAIAKPATPGCPVPQVEDISTNKLCRELDNGAIKSGPLFKRVLSALIFEDGRTLEGDEEIMSFLQFGDEDYKGSKCEDSLIQGLRDSISYGDEGNPCDDDDIKNIQSGISNNKLPECAPRSIRKEKCVYNLVEEGFTSEESLTSGSACSDESYQRMSVDLRLLLELQSLGIFPESLPDLVGDEHEAIIHNIFEAQQQVADQLSNDEECSKLLTETVTKGTSMNYEDVEGLGEEEAADPSHIPQLVQRKIIASRCSNPEVPKDAASLRTLPVPHASGAASSQAKQHARLTAGASITKNPEKGGSTLSCTDGALPDDHNDRRAEVLVSTTSKSKAKGESNTETAWGERTDKVLAASDAMTTNVNGKGETGTMNPVRFEESLSPTHGMLDGMELSYWLDTGVDDALGEGELFGLDIPMDDLSNVGLLL